MKLSPEGPAVVSLNGCPAAGGPLDAQRLDGASAPAATRNVEKEANRSAASALPTGEPDETLTRFATNPPDPAAPASGYAKDTGVRGFFTGTGLPLFMLAAAAVYEAFLLAVVFAPESTGAWGGFAREFKQWCFRYDARTGGMEWAAVWVMLVEPAFVVLVAAFLWRRGLAPLRTWQGWIRHRNAALAGVVAATAAMMGLYAYGRPDAGADAPLPFPGERIRTRLALPPFDFVDQKGRAFSLDELRGRVVLMTGIYAMCSSTCPEILIETKTLIESLPPELRSRVSVVALSLNPEEDTADLMNRVTEGYGFAYPEFRYLNGEPTGMHEALTRLGFARVRNPRTGVIDHANLFLLVDAHGEIAYRFTLDVRHRMWLQEGLVSLAKEVEGP
jgi:protein SCO1/2